jgi:hypothetical protein
MPGTSQGGILVSGVDCRRFRRDNTTDLLAGDAAEAVGTTRVAPFGAVWGRGRKRPSLAREHGWRVGLAMVAKSGNRVIWPAPSREHGTGMRPAEPASCWPVRGCGPGWSLGTETIPARSGGRTRFRRKNTAIGA